ncbi:hypothetical protein CEXT_580181 [Caerostris extrusa]|uniref:Uncharacterized protein n=1 Tax=Caerostris extrusa TaxID=172846 RepID=A0AAV4RBK8_CAEEX|nr:hypothetical protein CEXT_580181 [Caerostris extrusa]
MGSIPFGRRLTFKRAHVLGSLYTPHPLSFQERVGGRISWRGGSREGFPLGYTPLHIAAMFGHEEIMEVLINTYGADSSMRDYSGKRPLHYLPKTQAERKTDEIPISRPWHLRSLRFAKSVRQSLSLKDVTPVRSLPSFFYPTIPPTPDPVLYRSLNAGRQRGARTLKEKRTIEGLMGSLTGRKKRITGECRPTIGAPSITPVTAAPSGSLHVNWI